ncbi:MAG TPA: hypothetical protein VI758_05325, partial [Bacteroidota bacterium]
MTDNPTAKRIIIDGSKAMRSLVVILVFAVLMPVKAQKKEIIGYYPSWKWRVQDSLIRPEKIPFDKFTAINYAFFYPLPD